MLGFLITDGPLGNERDGDRKILAHVVCPCSLGPGKTKAVTVTQVSVYLPKSVQVPFAMFGASSRIAKADSMASKVLIRASWERKHGLELSGTDCLVVHGKQNVAIVGPSHHSDLLRTAELGDLASWSRIVFGGCLRHYRLHCRIVDDHSFHCVRVRRH